MNYRAQLGRHAEQFVATQLEKDGFAILARNYRIAQGEIDLIAMRKDLLVFVEVKMRQEQQFDLCDVITPSKQYKIIRAAKQYIALHGYDEKDCRFDVALLEGAEEMKCTYITNAFNESDCTW